MAERVEVCGWWSGSRQGRPHELLLLMAVMTFGFGGTGMGIGMGMGILYTSMAASHLTWSGCFLTK